MLAGGGAVGGGDAGDFLVARGSRSKGESSTLSYKIFRIRLLGSSFLLSFRVPPGKQAVLNLSIDMQYKSISLWLGITILGIV